MDKIVAAVNMRDFVLIITEQGVIYRAVWNVRDEQLEIRIETQINEVGK